jgi:hypothetical protein
VAEVLAGKYQVNEIDVLINTLKETVHSLSANVEVEMELGAKLREISHLKLKNSIMSSELMSEREMRVQIKTELKVYK